jgi:hypothetical protein
MPQWIIMPCALQPGRDVKITPLMALEDLWI